MADRILLLLFAFLIMCGSPVAANLQLELSAQQTQYLADEWIFVTLRLRNTGDSTIQVFKLLQPMDNFVSFEVTSPGEQPRPYCATATSDFVRPMSVDNLAPGESFSDTIDLTFEAGYKEYPMVRCLLSRPGEYVLRATYAVSEDWGIKQVSARSDEIRILVSEPQGVDRDAHGILTSNPPRYGPWGLDEARCESYRELLTRFPQSRYAMYAKHELAGRHALDSGGGNERGTPKSIRESRAAAKLYESAARDAGGTSFGSWLLRYAGRHYAEIRQFSRAQELLEQAFVSPAATDGDRMNALSTLDWMRRRYWQTGRDWERTAYEVRLPLRQLAVAASYSVGWDASLRRVTVSGTGLHCTFVPGSGRVNINGRERTDQMDTWLKDGSTYVSPHVLYTILRRR